MILSVNYICLLRKIINTNKVHQQELSSSWDGRPWPQ